jgi:hypothetical protein
MMRIGGKDPFIAIHVRSALEIELTDTDKAMKSTATIKQVEARTQEEAA